MEWKQAISGITDNGQATIAIVEALRALAEQLDYMNRLAEDRVNREEAASSAKTFLRGPR